MSLSLTRPLITVVKNGKPHALPAAPLEQKVTFATPFSMGGNHKLTVGLGTRLPRTGSGRPAEATPIIISKNIVIPCSSGNIPARALSHAQLVAAATTSATGTARVARSMQVEVHNMPTITSAINTSTLPTGTTAATGAATTVADTTTGTGGTRGDRPCRPSTFVFVPSPHLPSALRHPPHLPRPPSPLPSLSLSVSQ